MFVLIGTNPFYSLLIYQKISECASDNVNPDQTPRLFVVYTVCLGLSSLIPRIITVQFAPVETRDDRESNTWNK